MPENQRVTGVITSRNGVFSLLIELVGYRLVVDDSGSVTAIIIVCFHHQCSSDSRASFMVLVFCWRGWMDCSSSCLLTSCMSRVIPKRKDLQMGNC